MKKKKRSFRSRSQSTNFQQIGSGSGSDFDLGDDGPSHHNDNDIDNDIGLNGLHHSQSQNEGEGEDIGNESLSSSNQSLAIEPKSTSFAFLSSTREKVGRIMESKIVETIVLTMIMINAVMMGLGTFDFISKNDQAMQIFNTTDLTFTILFSIESSVRLFYMGYNFFTNGWVVFDFVLVAISWIPASGGVKALRALRILRVLTKVDMLKHVISSIIVVMPKMGAVALLLLLVMFIFSILFTQLFGDMYVKGQTEEDYFSRLDLTVLTLYQLMTLDGWNDLLREVMATYPWAWMPFFVYITLTGIVVTNIVIAVICDSVLYMTKKEEDDEKADEVNGRIKKMQAEIIAIRDVIDKKLNPGIGFEQLRQSQQVSPLRLTRLATGSDNIPLMMQTDETNNTGTASLGQLKLIRQRCGDFVNSDYVQYLITALIILNSLLMAIATFDFSPTVLKTFDTVDTVFLSIYTVESAMQVFANGYKITKDKWATFDLILVITSWAFFFTPIPVQAARSLRIIRILRLIPKLKSLKIIISAVVKVTPKLGGIAGILLLIFYIFAIIFTILFKDYPLSDDYFTRLDTTMFTLFQIMTMADWAEISRELAVFVPWAPVSA
mmetsp:Transcript_10479/g.15785  ORF Transcript_10479/g.15785 Transcript_10479/m.15785 type:complete len:608 (-) Transcript_10479:751-2574(-)